MPINLWIYLLTPRGGPEQSDGQSGNANAAVSGFRRKLSFLEKPTRWNCWGIKGWQNGSESSQITYSLCKCNTCFMPKFRQFSGYYLKQWDPFHKKKQGQVTELSRSCHMMATTDLNPQPLHYSKSNVLADQMVLLCFPEEYNICTDILPRTFRAYVLWEAMERMQ